MLADSLPYWPVNPLLSTSPWFTFQIDLVRCLWAILPATLLWGASFPLALAAAAPGQKDSGATGRRHLCRQHGEARSPARSASASSWCRGSERRAASGLLIVLAAIGAVLILAPLVSAARTVYGAAGLAAALAAAAVLAVTRFGRAAGC